MSDSKRLLAAVDLGSNSFHMLISRLVHGELRVVNRVRERVRIAAGLDSNRVLSEEVQIRALECLERFGEQLRNFPDDSVRAVGTNALRRAHNSRKFLKLAESRLGHPIEIISGHEEARLVYVGVASVMPPAKGRRLVVDIGGGSTECILGDGAEIIDATSSHMGCVAYTERFFKDGTLDRIAFRNAGVATQVELQVFQSTIAKHPFEEALGSSGTVHAIAKIANAAGWCNEGITLDALKRMRKAMIAAEQLSRVALPELKQDRRPVLPGGLAILIGVFESLGIDEMRPTPGALREGLLMDLLRRSQSEDVRERTIRKLLLTFQVDESQSRRVTETAMSFLEQARDSWRVADAASTLLLRWSATLHEIGMAISHSGYHKHGEYLLSNVEMAGFSRDEQRVLATQVRSHRKKIVRELFDDIPHLKPKQALRLCVLLRIAVLLHRTRGIRELPPVSLDVAKSTLEIRFPDAWLDGHPLTLADLEKEATLLEAQAFTLRFQ